MTFVLRSNSKLGVLFRTENENVMADILNKQYTRDFILDNRQTYLDIRKLDDDSQLTTKEAKE